MTHGDELEYLIGAADMLRHLHTHFDASQDTELGSAAGLRSVIGRQWLQRAAVRLQERADRWLRGGVALPSSEQAALTIIHGMAEELRAAGAALAAAADALRVAGAGLPANRAKQASTKAVRAAEGLVRA